MPRNAVVTGASAGLGREIVRQLVFERGYHVLATARRLDRLEALRDELPAGRVTIVAGDLADATFRAELWVAAERMDGGVDLLVNNAGAGHYAEFADQPPTAVRRIIELNVMAVFDLTQMAARHMKARGGGQILQIASILGFLGIPYSAAYAASKHAVVGLVRSLRYELRGTGVRVRAACPGRTESEFARVALGDPESTGPLPPAAPTARVARQILRGLDGRRSFIYPGFVAWATVAAAQWLPGPFDWFMSRWAPGYFRGEIERARGGK